MQEVYKRKQSVKLKGFGVKKRSEKKDSEFI
jgi:hypothetical protein